MKEKKISSTLAMGIITSLIFLVIYYFFHISITNLMAQNHYQFIKEKQYQLVEDILDETVIENTSDSSQDNSLSNRPGYEEYTMLKILKEISEQISLEEYEIPTGTMQMANPEKVDIETAALFQDSSGNILLKSGDYVLFPYTSEELWKQGEDHHIGYAFIDLNDFGKPDWQEELSKEIDAYDTSKVRIRKMKITGQIEEAEIIPSKIEILTEEAMIKSGSSYNQIVVKDMEGDIPWETIYENSAAVLDTQVTLYASDPEITFYPQENDLLSVLISKNFAPFNEQRNLNSLVHHSNQFIEIGEETYNLVYAVSGSPVNTAKNELKYVFNWARIILIFTWVSLNLVIYIKLIKPVHMVNQAFDGDFAYIWKEKAAKSLWREQTDLISHYLSMRNGTFRHKKETDELKNSLFDANQAEEYSREKMSNLAHDLKNPMTIIYTYSEALKENISEEKKEEYYEVILSEINHMEEMVIDMLDLSHKKEV